MPEHLLDCRLSARFSGIRSATTPRNVTAARLEDRTVITLRVPSNGQDCSKYLSIHLCAPFVDRDYAVIMRPLPWRI